MATNKYIPEPTSGFGTENGADPSEAAKGKPARTSIRAALRRIAGSRLDFSKPINEQTLRRIFGKDISTAQIAAVRIFAEGLRGDVKHLFRVDELLDGKLVERRVEAKVTLEHLLAPDEELTKRGYKVEDAEVVD